jgi:hypothetical protein
MEKNEQEMQKIKRLSPIVETRVTATPMPLLQRYLAGLGESELPQLFEIKPNTDYVFTSLHEVSRQSVSYKEVPTTKEEKDPFGSTLWDRSMLE